MATQRKLTWDDLKAAVQLKTFVLSLVILLLGLLATTAAFLFTGTTQLLLLALGSTLLTSSVFSAVSESMVRLDTVDQINAELDTFKADLLDELKSASKSSSFIHIPSRRRINFQDVVSTCSGRLRVVGISSNDILAPANCDHIFSLLETGRILSVEIVLQDPDSSAGKIRSLQPAYRNQSSMGTKVRAIVNELNELKSRAENLPGRPEIEYHLTSHPMTISAVADNNMVLVTPIICSRTGGASPTFQYFASGDTAEFYAAYVDHIDAVINQAKKDPSSG